MDVSPSVVNIYKFQKLVKQTECVMYKDNKREVKVGPFTN